MLPAYLVIKSVVLFIHASTCIMYGQASHKDYNEMYRVNNQLQTGVNVTIIILATYTMLVYTPACPFSVEILHCIKLIIIL